jgi:hypothetical protein
MKKLKEVKIFSQNKMIKIGLFYTKNTLVLTQK